MKKVLTIPSECIYPTQDNVEGNLVLSKGDYIIKSDDTKYMAIELLGVGTFGQVFRCVSNEGDEVAIKVVKSINRYFQYEMNEVRILKQLKEHGLTEHFVELFDAFIYKQHLCIVIELLGKNMYDLTKIFRFTGVSYNFLRTLLRQILEGLHELHNLGIIHCDLKPENILLADYFTYKVKIIDFGSSTTRTLSSSFYVQSRFYRAPEVILGIPYSSSVDMWSFGCLAFELFTGKPLFPGKDNKDQIMKIHDFYPNGLPLFMLEHGSNTSLYFNAENGYKSEPNSDKFTAQHMIDKIYSKYGTKEEHEMFVDLLMRVLNPSYLERLPPHSLLKHEFFNIPTQLPGADIVRYGARPTPREDPRMRKMSLYDFRSYDMDDDSFTNKRKGSLFDPDHENRYNRQF
ncbi:CMGC/DYRK/YAK protein kinase [Vittaforma corneae ATCC 50505]|uniref:CMGC/DYRK/YAK protein kinase n=1 Tax=Vittaforma corneae (strain ATCC 50505) TaxID=993615 RepID=L2GNF4_VITCO|nr:CMGC/DYRK/YAK protein kinase [Vittaforma corneae ATCC 50505]ELA42371.1 CMGC/DYRK/YAK protein kinase [Vittaforma corneae ATCC 50505]